MSFRKIRILFTSNSLAKGGKERQIVELVSWLSKNTNYDIGICIREDCILYSVELLDDVTFFKPSKKLKLRELIYYHLGVIKSFQPDIIHTWESVVGLSISILRITIFRNTKIIDGSIRYSRELTYWHITYWIVGFNNLIADNVITNSYAGLKSLGHKRKPKFQVIYNGFDFKRFLPYYSTKAQSFGSFKIGMVASFTPAKDYRCFIMAAIMTLIKRKDIHFYCIGDGGYREEIMNIIPISVKDAFIFTGNIENPEEYMKDFDIGILLSSKGHSEGMSNSIMEYMVLGLPVICTNAGGNVELVKNGENGFLVEVGDIEDIHEKVSTLLDNHELRKAMGVKSREIALSQFSINAVGNRYLELYNALLEK